MGKNSAIEWTHHTFNPWWGCVKVSAGCKHCYAETWSRRVGLDIWGARGERRFFSDAHWREPIRWNAEAAVAGIRRRVFCASMADVFEARNDLDLVRERLWTLIENTPALDWLLLTKRPEQIAEKAPWGNCWPPNVWLGTTAENQLWANRRIPILLEHPAVVRFVSCEPFVGHLDLSRWMIPRKGEHRINWVIAGGESGSKARPMNPEWVRSLRDQCQRAKVAFHFKQWGQWCPDRSDTSDGAKRMQIVDSFGKTSTIVRLGTAIGAFMCCCVGRDGR
ncbi:MAG: phage Gp37/Gp68 family protein [Alphaproteobacteria bacterium]|nr:phage Gp37/Gp68 family protein [Alphaproteobacteria bacterium]